MLFGIITQILRGDNLQFISVRPTVVDSASKDDQGLTFPHWKDQRVLLYLQRQKSSSKQQENQIFINEDSVMHFSFIFDKFLHLSEEFRTFIVLFSIHKAWFCLLNIQVIIPGTQHRFSKWWGRLTRKILTSKK